MLGWAAPSREGKGYFHFAIWSAETSRICKQVPQARRGNTWVNVRGRVLIKLYLQNRWQGGIRTPCAAERGSGHTW